MLQFFASLIFSFAIVVTGDTHEQFKPTIAENGTVIDLTQARFFALEDSLWKDGQPSPLAWPTQSQFDSINECVTGERYPVSIRGTASNVTIRGGAIAGKLNRLAPWHVWKMHGDGDAVRVELPGPYTVTGTYIDNVEDGIAPRGTGSFLIDGVFMDRIHDDAIENDEIRSGTIRDSYIRAHTFYSARGDNNPAAVVTVEDSVIELILQPHAGGSDGPDDLNTRAGYPFADGLGCGSLFKMERGTAKSGRLHCRRCVFLVPRHSTSSNGAMSVFYRIGSNDSDQAITYEQCTLVWLGSGEYPLTDVQPKSGPATVPTGLTITNDRAVFSKAKAAWVARHPEFASVVPADGGPQPPPPTNPPDNPPPPPPTNNDAAIAELSEQVQQLSSRLDRLEQIIAALRRALEN